MVMVYRETRSSEEEKNFITAGDAFQHETRLVLLDAYGHSFSRVIIIIYSVHR